MAAKTIFRIDGLQFGSDANAPYLVRVGDTLQMMTAAQAAESSYIAPQIAARPLSILQTNPNFADFITPAAIISALAGAGAGTTGANGEAAGMVVNSENIVLSTVGLTTDSVGNLLPANSIILAVAARVTALITVTTSWALGDATTAARFAAANSTLALGTTAVGLQAMQGSVSTDATGPVQAAAAKLRITCAGANPGAGVIRVSVVSFQLTPPTS